MPAETHCKCNNCDATLSFPSELVGTQTTCPTCGLETLLYSPPPAQAPPLLATPGTRGPKGVSLPVWLLLLLLAFAGLVGFGLGRIRVPASSPEGARAGLPHAVTQPTATAPQEPPQPQATPSATAARWPAPTAAPVSQQAINLRSRDALGLFEVQIHRILRGDQALAEGKVYAHQLDKLRSQGKELYYFDLSVKNTGVDEEAKIWAHNFSLEDASLNAYAPELTRDYLNGSIHLGRATRGGIAFGVYVDQVPKGLLYNTGRELAASGRTIYVSFDALNTLPVFQKR